ncbi:hypothetical protein [Streptomyces sp. NPDC017230]|uniref:hypothetical protein n=1 Tax=unclassified Streptomyces TaxID=2593676 RepID=UPI003789970B
MANPGYGKRLTGDEDPHADSDFAHLLPREAEVAVFIDHLDTGHSMGHKVLAAEHPCYGQQAMRTSLSRLSEAGHLRWIREHITVEDNTMRWVTRTYWSRTRKSEAWWEGFARERNGRIVPGDLRPGLARTEEPELPEPETESHPEPEPESRTEPRTGPRTEPRAEPRTEPRTGPRTEPRAEPRTEPRAEPRTEPRAEPRTEPRAEPRTEPTTSYLTLAGIRDAEPRMPLSEADCRSLASLAEEWLARGATPQDITRAVTGGLPATVNNPGGLARNRLENRMPPKKAKIRQKAAPRRARVTRAVICCMSCDADELTTKIQGGMCPDCRAEFEAAVAAEEAGQPDTGYVPDTFLADPDAHAVYEWVDVPRRAAEVRAAGGLRPRTERAL